jgi:predicted enzyme related to lactoylglutathione lyase
MRPTPLLQKVDSIRIPVPDIESGLAFYRDQLGHVVVWRLDNGAGLRLPGSDTELVLVPQGSGLQVNLHVAHAEAAAERFIEAGGRIILPAFKTINGNAVVVQDPFGNVYALRDDTLGVLVTNEHGFVLGTEGGENIGA